MTEIVFREAGEADLPAIVAMLADDDIGRGRETAEDLEPYRRAFRDMQAQGGNVAIVALDAAGAICGCFQYTLIPGLSRSAARRAQVEGVRVASSMRGQGLGERLMGEAIRMASADGAAMVQLTSDLRRKDAIRFYERLGFVHSHAGMKLDLPDAE
ncbi:MAG: N-acetyltransferase family protein [Minwuia sp.]|uniref:GNAT family N-acetyltransferase n=1 Tax=Minwuia sp. TaxID=2493630 RepID=UPI003A8616ED